MMIAVPAPGAPVATPTQNPLGQIHQLLQTVFSYVAAEAAQDNGAARE